MATSHLCLDGKVQSLEDFVQISHFGPTLNSGLAWARMAFTCLYYY